MLRRALPLAAALAAARGAPFGADSGIESVPDGAWFSREVLRRDDVLTLVVFYDEFSLTPARRQPLEEAARQLAGLARVVAADVGRPEIRWLSDAYGVRFLPGILSFPAEAKQPSSQAQHGVARPGGVKQGRIYDGPLQAEQLKNWAVSQLPDPTEMHRVNAQSAKDLDRLLDTVKGKPAVVLFTDKDKVSPLMKALALTLKGRIEVATVKAKGAKVLKELGVAKAPLLALYDAEGNRQDYTGKMAAAELAAFAEPHALPREERQRQLAAAESAELAHLRRRALEPVLHISSRAEWQQEVLERPHLSLVAFLDSSAEGHADYLASLEKVAKRERTSVRNVVWVEAAGQQALMSHFGLELGGAVFISPKRGKWTRFQGALTEQGLNRFIDGALARGQGARNLDPAKLPNFAE